MCKLLSNMGILSKADAPALELYCSTYAAWRRACEDAEKLGPVLVQTTDTGKVEAKRNPYDIVRERNSQFCRQMLSEFGLTPSSRTRVPAQEVDEDNPFAEYLRRRMAGG